MSNSFKNADGMLIVRELVVVIHENKQYLSEIDGKIGDGDHGINMDKGFRLFASRLRDDMNMSDAFKELGRTLLMEIGGSMGPLYGRFFKAMAKASRDQPEISLAVFCAMVNEGYLAIRDLGGASPGDKTMVDTLHPAVFSLQDSVDHDLDFSKALHLMVVAAEAGWKSTEDMVSKIGRSSRLGERSRGVLDAGATSCFYLFRSMAESILEILG